jgi:putative transposase
MYRAHLIRLNPTEEQADYFRKACGTARFAFNWLRRGRKRSPVDGA